MSPEICLTCEFIPPYSHELLWPYSSTICRVENEEQAANLGRVVNDATDPSFP